MLRKKTGYILPQPITRISREEQLPHTSIDESSTCRALEKSGYFLLHFRILGGIVPRYGRFIFETFNPEETIPEFSSREPEVVTPEELEADRFRAFIFTLSIAVNAFAEWSGAVFEGEEVLMDLAGCNAAEGEPGRELGAEVFTQGAVTGIFVTAHAAACYEVLNPLVSGIFATVERVGRGGAWGLFGWMRKAEGGFERLVKVFDNGFQIVGDGEGVRLRWYRRWKRREL